MASNVEIKARVRDAPKLRTLAESLSGSSGRLIEQEDTFFHVPEGRLKLRVFSPSAGELIYYQRADQQGPKQCHYLISATNDPRPLKSILAAALGTRGIVRKKRRLFLVGQTRIHLDEVEGLGDFLELEVVLQPGQSPDDGTKIAWNLMTKLGIQEQDLIEGAYIDLLLPPEA